jgi:hypothetical protein
VALLAKDPGHRYEMGEFLAAGSEAGSGAGIGGAGMGFNRGGDARW